MNILILEDNENKKDNIKNTLSRILENPIIDWAKSRNSGLRYIMNHNYKKRESEPYDMIICDNYMPIFDDETIINPYGAEIINEIREHFKLVSLPIIICSSEEMEECDYTYKVKYNSSMCMDDIFKKIIDDILLHNENGFQLSQNISCRGENSEKTLNKCLSYINHSRN